MNYCKSTVTVLSVLVLVQKRFKSFLVSLRIEDLAEDLREELKRC